LIQNVVAPSAQPATAAANTRAGQVDRSLMATTIAAGDDGGNKAECRDTSVFRL